MNASMTELYHSLNLDESTGTVELISYNFKLRIEPREKKE